MRKMMVVLSLLLVIGAAYLFRPWVEPSTKSATDKTSRFELSVEGELIRSEKLSEPKAKLPSANTAKLPYLNTAKLSQQRKTLLRRLTDAREKNQQAGLERTRRSDLEPPKPLEIANKTGNHSEWEKRQIGLLNDLMGECYELARDATPGLKGRLGLTFTLTAEPEVGGLLEEVSFLEDYSDMDDSLLRECARESLYALELDPPDEGVQVKRQLTLRFGEEED